MSKVLEIYTDGNCKGNQFNENVGGWGAYLVFGKHTKKLNGAEVNTTNQRMELTGCIKGLEAIKDRTVKTIVYLDSQYVFKGLTDWADKWKKNNWRKSDKKPVENKEYWEHLLELRDSFTNINFKKIKGHSGIEGNEIADSLASEAISNMD